MALRNLSKLFNSLTISAPLNTGSSFTNSYSLLQQTLNRKCLQHGIISVWSNRHVHSSNACLHPAILIKDGKTPLKYTLKTYKMKRDGGRDPETGRRINRRGGGHQRRYRMVDKRRIPPADGSVLEERVLDIKYDPNRTARIAIVGNANYKRYILASMNMKTGDIIKTSGKIGRMTVFANEGDAYPLGALPVGSLVHNVEPVPGVGGMFAQAAGTSALLLKKADGHVILQLPSKRQISVSEKCMATVGRLSNEEHNKRKLGKAGRKRWLGFRQRSGLWQRKGGWAGRKIKPLPPVKVYSEATWKRSPSAP